MPGKRLLKFLLSGCWLFIFLFGTRGLAEVHEDVTLESIMTGISYQDSLLEHALKEGIKFEFSLSQNSNHTGKQEKNPFSTEKLSTAELEPDFLNKYCFIMKDGLYSLKITNFIFDKSKNQKLVLDHLTVYDGKQTRVINNIDSAGVFYLEKRAPASMPVETPFTFSYPRLKNDSFLYIGNYSPFLGKTLKEKKGIRLIGKEEINGHTCYILREDYGNKVFSTWICPDFGFNPLRNVREFSNSKTVTEITGYQKCGDIWVLEKGVRRAYYKNPGSGQNILGSEIIVQLQSCEIQNIPDSAFQLEFPENLKSVWDGTAEVLIKPSPAIDSVRSESDNLKK